MKRWFLPAAARARGQSNDLNREILVSNLFNCCKEVINAPPVPSISRCIHIFYRHKNVWEYQWSNFIYNCMSTFLHYVHCKDALLDCSAPGGERCESLTRVDEILLPHLLETNKLIIPELHPWIAIQIQPCWYNLVKFNHDMYILQSLFVIHSVCVLLVIKFPPIWRKELWNLPYRTLHWRHNELDGVSNHQPHYCSLNR